MDAIMDEFLATRRELESKMGTHVFSLNDALVRLEKEIPLEEQQIKASEQSGASPETLIKQKASLQQVKMAYDRLLATLRQLDVHRADGAPSITILEHASRDSASPGMVLDPPPSIYDRYIKRFINLFR